MALPTRTVIIHGWSDCSESFAGIKKFLVGAGAGPVESIFYADYESREDHITFDDVADGLHREFQARGFITADGAPKADLNVIVHSTGGLVIRHWIARFCMGPNPAVPTCPVKRIVMLAPANFGSPLAHRGKSFLGSLFKGRWKLGDLLEVGRLLLDGLELGSPYQWKLAHRDLLSGTPPYAPDRIQVTILVGAEDYTGMRGWVNKPGTDGTVVIAGTSLDSLKLTLDCTKAKNDADGYTPYTWSEVKAVDEFAFGVLPGLNHGSIVDNPAQPGGGLVGPILLRALSARTAPDFRALIKEMEARTRQTYTDTGKAKFQQFIVHAVDDDDNPISDFTLEFFVCKAKREEDGLVRGDGSLTQAERSLSDDANRIISAEFHPHSVDPSYRRFLINLPALRGLLATAGAKLGGAAVLSMRVYVPRVDRGIEYATSELQNIALLRTDEKRTGPTFLYENTTTLLELRVDRKCDYVRVGTEPRKH